MSVSQFGYVYFIYAPGINRVKIGFSASYPDARFIDLQVGSPVRLSRLGFFRGDEGDEGRTHLKFLHLHTHGEWFDFGEELRDFAAATLEPWPNLRTRKRSSRVSVPTIRQMVPSADLVRLYGFVPTRRCPVKSRWCMGWTTDVWSHQKVQCHGYPDVSIGGLGWCSWHADQMKTFEKLAKESRLPILPD